METSEKGKVASSELVYLHFQNMKNKIRFHKKKHTNNNIIKFHLDKFHGYKELIEQVSEIHLAYKKFWLATVHLISLNHVELILYLM